MNHFIMMDRDRWQKETRKKGETSIRPAIVGWVKRQQVVVMDIMPLKVEKEKNAIGIHFLNIWMDEEAEHLKTLEKCAYLLFSTTTYVDNKDLFFFG